ncbi:LapA family protein [Phytoactinopolyspora halotolerans]|uniref:LapA family protein n=1 Tax=Phytoactinopolyspora halotolerans TaxID=1981512 RepID=A0A6L9SAE0_9ACTN|nr:LapA family protein [Phytoactinopolyspora halotolerans]NEE01532.1 LapA family protein [Phytoactinopolyspora halotolerans]
MIVLAIILLAAAIALVAVVVLEGGETVTMDVFDTAFDIPAWGVFLAGAGAGFVALAGVAMLLFGIRQVQERRRELEYLRKKVREQERSEPDIADDEPSGPDTTGSWSAYGRRGRPVDIS